MFCQLQLGADQLHCYLSPQINGEHDQQTPRVIASCGPIIAQQNQPTSTSKVFSSVYLSEARNQRTACQPSWPNALSQKPATPKPAKGATSTTIASAAANAPKAAGPSSRASSTCVKNAQPAPKMEPSYGFYCLFFTHYMSGQGGIVVTWGIIEARLWDSTLERGNDDAGARER